MECGVLNYVCFYYIGVKEIIGVVQIKEIIVVLLGKSFDNMK